MRDRREFPKYEIMLEFVAPDPPRYEALRVAVIDVLPGRVAVSRNFRVGPISILHNSIRIKWPKIEFLLDGKPYPLTLAATYVISSQMANNVRDILSAPYQLRMSGGLCHIFHEICVPEVETTLELVEAADREPVETRVLFRDTTVCSLRVEDPV